MPEAISPFFRCRILILNLIYPPHFSDTDLLHHRKLAEIPGILHVRSEYIKRGFLLTHPERCSQVEIQQVDPLNSYP